MTSRRSVMSTAVCAGWMACVAVTLAQEPAEVDVVLVHAFRLPPGESWAPVIIDLSPGLWRVGGPSGPLASEGQLRLALGALIAVELGGRCAGWIDGATAYPCGFSLRDIDFAGAVPERYAAIAVDQQSVVAAARAQSEFDAATQRGASSSPTAVRADAERFVALRLPPAYLGDQRQAFGGALHFEIRALSNLVMPSRFDRASGQVVL
ncbi:MAG TPA: hypothetical protein VML58_08715, partial [Burkholderiaceae bacterium]|nr:hypothetical protein [Burkholderiaceae bacterium]